METVIINILKSEIEKNNNNEYVIFFDDLDIGFNADSEESLLTIMELLRASKHVNNNIFAKNGILAKVIILIRDDVERTLSSQGADIAKIFSSYSTRLDWYQDEYQSLDKESSVGLKKLVERRTKYAFEKAGFNYNSSSAWDSLINDDFTPKSSFKYISDHTYLRPRDFILLLKPLENGEYEIPLNKYYVNNLIGLYATELIKELTNELSSFYSVSQ
ncbi:P-loop ATPase, Sll1717 family, partial [Acinetobacter sp. NigerLNRRAM0016]